MATPKTTAAAIAVAALFLASIAAYLVYDYLSAKEREATSAKMEVQQVVVAAVDIPFGAKLQPVQLKTAGWPKSSLPAGFSADPNALNDRLTIAAIPAGSPVLASSLAPANEGAAGVLSYIIPQGHRAVTVAVNEVVGVAGFIMPDSIVDVVATVNSPYKSAGTDNRISKIILQNIKVLAIGQILDQKEGKPVTVPTVTLDVTPDQAEKLVIASENKVQLILKHTGDKDETKTGGATVATMLGGAPPAAAAERPAAGRVVTRSSGKPSGKEPGIYIEIIKGDKRTREEFR